MIDRNGSEWPLKGAETTCELPSYRRFDTSMPQCAVTVALGR